MDIMKKLNEAIDTLDDIDVYGNSLSERLSILDTKQQDLLHYIENNKINMLWCYRMIREIKSIREERRKVKNDMELFYRFNELKNRITSKDNRRFVLTELHKKEKQLDSIYKNRQYTDEELLSLLKGDKK